mgnify:CR=1 FL=1
MVIFKNKKDLIFLVAVIIIHLIYFSISVFQNNYYPFSGSNYKISDSYQYLVEAENIINNGVFYSGDLSLPINPIFYTIRPPGYPIFLALFNYFNASLAVVLFFQNIISIISIFLVRKTILLFNYKTAYDPLFIILLILTPSQFIYANAILTEVVFQLFLVLMFRYAILFLKFKTYKNVLWYSLALIIATYIKPAMYLFVIPSTLYMVYLSFKQKKWYPVIVSVLPILAIVFILNWNYKRTNHYQYSSIQTINLLDYNLKFFLLSREGEEKTTKILDSIHNRANLEKSFAEKTNYLDNASKNILKEHIFPYTFYHLQGSLYAILDPGRFDLAYFFKLKSKNANQKGILYHINNGGIKSVLRFLFNSYSLSLLFVLGIIIFFNTIKLFGFIYFLFNKSIKLNFRFITACLFFYIVLLVGPVGASRYLMPLVPIIIGACLMNTTIVEYILKKLKLASAN